MKALLKSVDWVKVIFKYEFVLLILIILLFGCAALVMPNFLSLKGQLLLSRQLWEMAFLAIPMTFIIITGGIDLSVGSTMGLSAVSFGLTYSASKNIWLAASAAVVTGILCGAINGLFIARVKIHPLIVTLATFALFRGIAEGLSQGVPYSGFDSSYSQLARGQLLGIPIGGYLFVILALAGWAFLRWTVPGRQLYNIGHNRRCLEASGIRIGHYEFFLYTFSGLIASISSLFLISRFNTAKADAGTAIELDVITAVVVGGTSIFGGRGTLLGTTLGLILIHETRLFTSRYFQTDELKIIIVGVLLILSVLIHKATHRSSTHTS